MIATLVVTIHDRNHPLSLVNRTLAVIMLLPILHTLTFVRFDYLCNANYRGSRLTSGRGLLLLLGLSYTEGDIRPLTGDTLHLGTNKVLGAHWLVSLLNYGNALAKSGVLDTLYILIKL